MAAETPPTPPSTTSTTTVITDGASTGGSQALGDNSGASAAAGITSGSVATTTTTTSSQLGKAYDYVVVVQIPVPFLNLDLNLDLLGDFILPALSILKVPQAITYALTHVESLFQTIIDDVQDLILAIPEASATILVKMGQVTVFNVRLVAEKVPVIVTLPTFQLGLPNFAVDLGFYFDFPAAEPVVIRIPIPYPVLSPIQLLSVSGGNVSATAGAGVTAGTGTDTPTVAGGASASVTPAGAQVIPPSIESPIVLPVI